MKAGNILFLAVAGASTVLMSPSAQAQERIRVEGPVREVDGGWVVPMGDVVRVTLDVLPGEVWGIRHRGWRGWGYEERGARSDTIEIETIALAGTSFDSISIWLGEDGVYWQPPTRTIWVVNELRPDDGAIRIEETLPSDTTGNWQVEYTLRLPRSLAGLAPRIFDHPHFRYEVVRRGGPNDEGSEVVPTTVALWFAGHMDYVAPGRSSSPIPPPDSETWSMVMARDGEYRGRITLPPGSYELRIAVESVIYAARRFTVANGPENLDYVPPPRIAFAASQFPAEPVAGLPFHLALRVENRGTIPSAATVVDVAVQDPATGAALPGLQSTGRFCEPTDGGRFRCDLGDLDPGDVADLTFMAELPMRGVAAWEAEVTSAGDIFVRDDLAGLIGEPRARIAEVVVLTDQERIQNTIVSHPHPLRSGERGDSRLLMLIGWNLRRPTGVGSAGLPDADTETVDYGIFSDSHPHYEDYLDEGWQAFWGIEDAEEARARALEAGLDAIIVTAGVNRGALPGNERVVFDGATGNWTLKFGDLRGELAFARELPDGSTEALRNAYVPELIRVAVRLNAPLVIDEIPVLLDTELATTEGGGEVRLTARRHPTEPGLFLTGPINLFRPSDTPTYPGGFAIPVPTGVFDPPLLRVRIDPTFAHESLNLPVDPLVAEAALRVTPRENEFEWTWNSALARAAACHPGITVEDWRTLPLRESEEIWSLMIFTRSDHFPGQSVLFGHHAAAILARDMFLMLMERQVLKLEWIAGNAQAVRGLLAYMRPLADEREMPLNRMRVNHLFGGEIEYRYVILNDEDWLADLYDVTVPQIRAWRERETRVAVERMISAARDAITQARAAGDCDIEELVRLTGFGFEPVNRWLRPEMMRLSDVTVGGRRAVIWEPDLPARAWVDRLDPLAQAVRRQQAEANVDTDIALAVTGLAAMPLMLFQNTTLVLIAFAIDLADLAVTTMSELGQYVRSQEELEFAIGAAALIGTERHETALRDQKGWASTAFAVGTSALGAAMGGLDAIPQPVMVDRIARGRAVTRAVEDVASLLRRPQADLQDFVAFAMSARARSVGEGPGALTPIERRALELTEEHARTAAQTAGLPEPDLPPASLVDTGLPSSPIRWRSPGNEDGIGTAPEPAPGRIPSVRRGGETPNALMNRVAPDGSQVTFRTTDGVERMELGPRLGTPGSTSEAFAHPGNPENLVIRVTTQNPNSPAALLDAFGERAITELSSPHIRVVRQEHVFETVPARNDGGVTRVSVNERIETAREVIARRGSLTPEQQDALLAALRDLNRAGLVWLDNHPGNFGFVTVGDRVQVVVLDAGGLFRVRVDSDMPAPVLARTMQQHVNGSFDWSYPQWTWLSHGLRDRVRRDEIAERFGEVVDLEAMGIPLDRPAGEAIRHWFNPRSGTDFEDLAQEFDREVP